MRRALGWLVIGVLALSACGGRGAETEDPADPTNVDQTPDTASLDEGIGTRVCDLLEADHVARYDTAADGTGVYDGFLTPLADVCRYESAFTLQLDYGPLMGEPADVTTYLNTMSGTTAEAITVGGFEGFLDYTEADAELGTDAFVNQVFIQVGEWVLILDPDGLIDPFGPESAVLQELAGIAAGRI